MNNQNSTSSIMQPVVVKHSGIAPSNGAVPAFKTRTFYGSIIITLNFKYNGYIKKLSIR